ncbi:MAG: methyltransferase [Candidatus Nanoarchaeia archaeon]|nr:methyltransferase [Candidatus Nanoarchaeia archaeon]
MVNQNFKVTTDIKDFLKKSRQHKKPYFYELKGKTFYITPNIMSPKFSYAPQFFMDYWNIQENDTVLDVGTGSGVLAIFASDIAKKVIATDINPYCLESVKKSIEINNADVELRIGNMFDIVKEDELFSKIFFNAPYFSRKPKDNLERAVFDKDYKAMEAFLKDAKHHLTRNGQVLVGFSELGDVKRIEKMMEFYMYEITRKDVETYGHTRILYTLDRWIPCGCPPI